MAADEGKLNASELIELENPREERSFTKYYSDLNEEQLLGVSLIDDREYYTLMDNSPYMNAHSYKNNNVDIERLKLAKRPSFRKITASKLRLSHQKITSSGADYERLGYYNTNKRIDIGAGAYKRPNLHCDALIKGKLLFSDNNEFQVHYNMDEQDLLFLEYINEKYSSSISMELFEIMVTYFESELYKIARILPPTIKDRTSIDIQQYQRAILYGSDDGTGCSPEAEQECAICGDEESDNSNAIVFCDGCDIAVHQECYGVSFIPEGPWLCRRCLIQRNTNVQCLLCPSTTGAFKQTDGGDWAHVICTLWINELYFANPIYMEPIEGIDNIPRSRWRLICYICKRKMGACVQCSKSSCFQAYHATCGKRAGLYMKMRRGIGGALQNQSSLITYCDKHSSQEWNRTHNIQTGIQKTKLYFNDIDTGILKPSDSDLVPVTNKEYNELLETQSKRFQWRLSPSVYVIPEKFLNKFDNFLKLHNISSIDRNISHDIAKYYSLKVEQFGQQLIKKPDVFNMATLGKDELKKRRAVVSEFQNEIEKLATTARVITKREASNKSQIHEQLETGFKRYQPYQYIILDLLSTFIGHINESYDFPRNSVKPNINEIIEKAKKFQYEDIDKVIYDVDRFQKWLNKHETKYKDLKQRFTIWNRCKARKINKAKELIKDIKHWKTNVCNDIDLNESLEIIEREQKPRIGPPHRRKATATLLQLRDRPRNPRRKVTRVAKQVGRVLRSGKNINV